MGARVKRYAVRIAEVVGYATIIALTFAVAVALVHVVDTIVNVYNIFMGD